MSNLYDNPVFFQNYLDLRNDTENYNDLFEQPHMMDMLPDEFLNLDAVMAQPASNSYRQVLNLYTLLTFLRE